VVARKVPHCSKNRRGAEAYATFAGIAQTARNKAQHYRIRDLSVSLFVAYSDSRPLIDYGNLIRTALPSNSTGLNSSGPARGGGVTGRAHLARNAQLVPHHHETLPL